VTIEEVDDRIVGKLLCRLFVESIVREEPVGVEDIVQAALLLLSVDGLKLESNVDAADEAGKVTVALLVGVLYPLLRIAGVAVEVGDDVGVAVPIVRARTSLSGGGCLRDEPTRLTGMFRCGC
jgi:hypothetical protein